MNDIIERVVLPEPPDLVWKALTSRELVSEWLMPTADYDPSVGHRFVFRAPKMPGWDGVINCVVLEVNAMSKLVWSWQGSNMRRPTRVSFVLEPSGTGTLLTLEHSGFEGVGGFILSRMHRSGWRGRFLRRSLPSVLVRLQQHMNTTGRL